MLLKQDLMLKILEKMIIIGQGLLIMKTLLGIEVIVSNDQDQLRGIILVQTLQLCPVLVTIHPLVEIGLQQIFLMLQMDLLAIGIIMSSDPDLPHPMVGIEHHPLTNLLPIIIDDLGHLPQTGDSVQNLLKGMFMLIILEPAALALEYGLGLDQEIELIEYLGAVS